MILLMTSNSGKCAEFETALQGSGRVSSLANLPGEIVREFYSEPQEDQDFFAGNAWIKLKSAVEFLGESGPELEHHLDGQDVLLIVDDSGLVVPGLNGDPGVHSAYFAGLPRDDTRNRQLLAERVLGVTGHPLGRLDAYFVCVLLSCRVALADAAALRADMECWEKSSPVMEPEWEQRALKDLLAQKLHAQTASRSLVERSGSLSLCLTYGLSFGEVGSVEQNLIPHAGHGYDSLFFPDQCPDRSFASIEMQRKNEMSHRGAALSAHRTFLMDSEFFQSKHRSQGSH